MDAAQAFIVWLPFAFRKSAHGAVCERFPIPPLARQAYRLRSFCFVWWRCAPYRCRQRRRVFAQTREIFRIDRCF